MQLLRWGGNNGKERVFAELGNGANAQFYDRNLYLFAYDLNGINVANGNNTEMVGKNLLGMKGRNGKFIKLIGLSGEACRGIILAFLI